MKTNKGNRLDIPALQIHLNHVCDEASICRHLYIDNISYNTRNIQDLICQEVASEKTSMAIPWPEEFSPNAFH